MPGKNFKKLNLSTNPFGSVMVYLRSSFYWWVCRLTNGKNASRHSRKSFKIYGV